MLTTPLYIHMQLETLCLPSPMCGWDYGTPSNLLFTLILSSENLPSHHGCLGIQQHCLGYACIYKCSICCTSSSSQKNLSTHCSSLKFAGGMCVALSLVDKSAHVSKKKKKGQQTDDAFFCILLVCHLGKLLLSYNKHMWSRALCGWLSMAQLSCRCEYFVL